MVERLMELTRWNAHASQVTLPSLNDDEIESQSNRFCFKVSLI